MQRPDANHATITKGFATENEVRTQPANEAMAQRFLTTPLTTSEIIDTLTHHINSNELSRHFIARNEVMQQPANANEATTTTRFTTENEVRLQPANEAMAHRFPTTQLTTSEIIDTLTRRINTNGLSTHLITTNEEMQHPANAREDIETIQFYGDGNRKRFACDDCDKSFSKSNDLTRHQRTHSGARPYQCLVCGKCYAQVSHLTLHQRKHTGSRPFVCNACGKSFTDKSNLRQHVRIHSNEKPFVCSLCGRSFRQSGHLTKHAATHARTPPVVTYVVC